MAPVRRRRRSCVDRRVECLGSLRREGGPLGGPQPYRGVVGLLGHRPVPGRQRVEFGGHDSGEVAFGRPSFGGRVGGRAEVGDPLLVLADGHQQRWIAALGGVHQVVRVEFGVERQIAVVGDLDDEVPQRLGRVGVRRRVRTRRRHPARPTDTSRHGESRSIVSAWSATAAANGRPGVGERAALGRRPRPATDTAIGSIVAASTATPAISRSVKSRSAAAPDTYPQLMTVSGTVRITSTTANRCTRPNVARTRRPGAKARWPGIAVGSPGRDTPSCALRGRRSGGETSERHRTRRRTHLRVIVGSPDPRNPTCWVGNWACRVSAHLPGSVPGSIDT